MSATQRQDEDDEEDEVFLRRLVLPEEDRRRLYPTMPWTGGWRWFRSPNVVCLEQWRKKRDSRATLTSDKR